MVKERVSVKVHPEKQNQWEIISISKCLSVYAIVGAGSASEKPVG